MIFAFELQHLIGLTRPLQRRLHHLTLLERHHGIVSAMNEQDRSIRFDGRRRRRQTAKTPSPLVSAQTTARQYRVDSL